MTSLATMNYLFYLGIVLPTLVTVLIFLVFLGCWRRLSARREMLTKRHDPHGRMRAMGLPLLPPPPPLCVRSCSLRLGELGNSDDGFTVSRSASALHPSASALAMGGPGLYQTVPAPDSGLGPELLDLMHSPGESSLGAMGGPGMSGLPMAMPGMSGMGMSKMAMSPMGHGMSGMGVSGMGGSGMGGSGVPNGVGGAGPSGVQGSSGAAAAGASGKDRPESQASHGSSDSQDSGFRSSRSGQYLAGATPHAHTPSQETPLLRTPHDSQPPSSFTRSRSEHHREWSGARGPGLGAWLGSGRARNPPDRLSPRATDKAPVRSEASPHSQRQFSPHGLAHLSPKRLNTFSQPEGEGTGRHPPQTLDLQDISIGGQAGWRFDSGLTPLPPKPAPRHLHGCGGTHTTALVHGNEGDTDLMGYSVV